MTKFCEKVTLNLRSRESMNYLEGRVKIGMAELISLKGFSLSMEGAFKVEDKYEAQGNTATPSTKSRWMIFLYRSPNLTTSIICELATSSVNDVICKRD